MLDTGKNSLFIRVLKASILWICRRAFKIEYSGVENIPSSGPLIVASNHTTFLDPIFVALPINLTMRFMAWDEVFRIPLLSFLARWAGAFPVNLEKANKSALKMSLQVLKNRQALVIFPEGGRSLNGQLRPFKPGVAQLAIASKTPVLPVTIRGGERVWPPKQRLPRRGKIEVIFHRPIRIDSEQNWPPKFKHDLINQLIKQISNIIEQGLNHGLQKTR